jgi:uncharacterized alpha-E superfamily protein
MLSRVAERVFWMARYLERAESTARIANTFSQIRMDLPRGSELPWQTLLEIFGADGNFDDLKRSASEHSVLNFMLARVGNPNSIRFSVTAARENARTAREVLPEEVWELVNELHLFTKEFAEKSVARRNRFDFLMQIVTRCQALSGLMMTTQTRDHAYRFITFGHLVERLDLNARVILAVSAAIDSREGANPAFDGLIWAGFLEALSALGTYKRSVGPMVEPHSALNFVIRNPDLPRSIVYCLNTIRMSLKSMKSSEKVITPIDQSLKNMYTFDAEEMSVETMHNFVSGIQSCAERLTNNATNNWFLPISL